MIRRVALLLAGLVGASFLVPVLATSAGAWTVAGQVEVCKASAPAPLGVTGKFTFTVSGVTSGGGSFTLTAGAPGGTAVCSAPRTVTSATGSATITETQGTWYAVNSITALPGSDYLTSTNLATGAANVTLAANTVSEVTYTNKLLTGDVEICKATAAGSGLTGVYSFEVTSLNDGFSTTVSTPVGTCTAPLTVPAGTVAVTEAGTNLYVTGVTADFNGGSTSAIVGVPNTTTGRVTVTVKASPDASNQTDVTYTNEPVALKVCKAFSGTLPRGVTSFPFSFTVSGPPGPAGPTSAASIAPGTCQIVGSYRAGTEVTITEGAVPGTKVLSIGAAGADSVVLGTATAPNPNPLNGTISILMGTSVTSGASSPGNEGVITYTDELALPGQLKLCKTSGTTPGPPTIATATFTVSGVSQTVSIPVPAAGATNCVVIGNFPFNSVVKITETGLTAPNVVSGISVVPTLVAEETSPGVFALTSEQVVATPPNLAAGTVSVTIGEGDTTEVDYTDIDPPPPVLDGGSTVVDPGSNGGTTTGADPALATSIGSDVATVIAAAPTTVARVRVSPSAFTAMLSKAAVKALTPRQRAALMRTDERLLSRVSTQISRTERLLASAKGTARHSDLVRLAALRAKGHVLRLEIVLIKEVARLR